MDDPRECIKLAIRLIINEYEGPFDEVMQQVIEALSDAKDLLDDAELSRAV